jgi:hypothetical protein
VKTVARRLSLLIGSRLPMLTIAIGALALVGAKFGLVICSLDGFFDG